MAEHQGDYRDIVSHYEDCLARHGDTHFGVDWPNAADAAKRYDVMLDLLPARSSGTDLSLLDFGCGASHLYEHMQAGRYPGISYAGLDLSPRFVELSRTKFPENRYWCLDLLESSADSLPEFDYVIMNGVFTEKRELSFEAMLDYFERLLARTYEHARFGLAFNVMSKHVDWERDDLFHLPFDTLARILTSRLSRHFVFRNDYGLYEYTTYVFKEGVRWQK
jgi:SAM-dependent methyltransferase